MEGLKNLDLEIVTWMNRLVGRHDWMDAIGEALVSDYLIPVMLILGLMWLWFSTDEPASSGLLAKKTVIAAILAMAFANLAVLVLNEVYFRPRPFTEVELNLLFYRPTDSSFPSNPAALSFALAFSVLQRQRGLGLALIALATIWSFSRVFAGVFYVTDVAAGAAMGVIIAWGSAQLLRWLEPLPTAVVRLIRTLHLA